MKRVGNRVQVTAYLSVEQKQALDQLRAVTRVPVQEYLLEGVDMVLDRYKKELRRSKR